VTNRKRSRPGAVRIIGGVWRGRKLPIPAGSTVRPTPDRVRETLFNWLGSRLPGASCIDLYAGTGVLGFEALSRGAAHVVFVEQDAAVAGSIQAQCRVLGASAEVIRADARRYLDRPGAGPFDLAFVDPPYSASVLEVFESLPAVLASGAHVYLERERGALWPESDRIEWVRRGSAGAVEFGLAVVRF
jgi:16S rRNA (guanine966-N2)-methyltransferase